MTEVSFPYTWGNITRYEASQKASDANSIYYSVWRDVNKEVMSWNYISQQEMKQSHHHIRITWSCTHRHTVHIHLEPQVMTCAIASIWDFVNMEKNLAECCTVCDLNRFSLRKQLWEYCLKCQKSRLCNINLQGKMTVVVHPLMKQPRLYA